MHETGRTNVKLLHYQVKFDQPDTFVFVLVVKGMQKWKYSLHVTRT